MANKQNMKEYTIQIIRENLRQSSTRQAALLARSVGRLTSCDVQPCLEYRQEIASEHAVIDRLMYLQECRNSLERCISSGAARLRYRWRDGRVTDTCFRRTARGRIRVSGLLADPALRAAG
ncbi:MAG: hypothetical protein K2K53_07670 [Oscillospiraceae bacterium]|nr:hypothetical protein [Oscillospiraceae bacterium]